MSDSCWLLQRVDSHRITASHSHHVYTQPHSHHSRRTGSLAHTRTGTTLAQLVFHDDDVTPCNYITTGLAVHVTLGEQTVIASESILYRSLSRTCWDQPAYIIWSLFPNRYEKGYKMWKMGWFGLVRGNPRSLKIVPFDRTLGVAPLEFRQDLWQQ